MKTYQIKFKPVDPQGIIFCVTTEAESKDKALIKACEALKNGEMEDTHRFYSIVEIKPDQPGKKLIPVLNIPMMSDEKWKEITEKDHRERPELYAELYKNMREHPEQFPGMVTPLEEFDK